MFILKRIAIGFLAVLIILILLVAGMSVYFAVQRNHTAALPQLTGLYDVGRINYDWTDPARTDPFSSVKGMKRKLSVWIWYPADLLQDAKRTAYFPGKWLQIQNKSNGLPFLMQNYKAVRTNSYTGGNLSSRKSAYPVLLFEPGMGDIVLNYQALAENLASHGFIVVGLNPTYSSRFVVFENGTVAYRTPAGNMPEDNPSDRQLNQAAAGILNTWTEDMTFAIRHLDEMNAAPGSMWTGRLDMQHIGAFGHSFGGAASAEAGLLDSRITAGVDIDGYLYGIGKQINKPFMFIMSKHGQDSLDRIELGKIKHEFAALPNKGYLIEILGASHFNFQDGALFFNPILHTIGVYGTIHAERGLQITNAYLTAFFDKYLNHVDSPLMRQHSVVVK